MTPKQCQQARALLGWDEWKLSRCAKLSETTIKDLEAGTRRSHAGTFISVRAALEAAGIIFVNVSGSGPGVRLQKAAR